MSPMPPATRERRWVPPPRIVFAHGAPLHLPGVMPFFGPAPHLDARARDRGPEHRRWRWRNSPTSSRCWMPRPRDIAADRIVALCHGRMEFGARALGNRSLLALPSKAANKDRINLAIKKRQNYRPFAPAVAAEDAHRYFVLNAGEEYPYMTMLTRVREEAQASAAGGHARGRHRARADRDAGSTTRNSITCCRG